MPEQPAFLERYSTRSVLRYHAALLGLSNTAIKTQVDRIIQDFQMHEFADRPCLEYSQGMRQRLALGIAIMNDPQVLLLDEPSNGLDPLGIIQLRERLQQLRDRGTTIMVSSHRLGELEKLTSHYLFIYQGRLIDISDGQSVGQAGYLHVTLAPDSDELAPELLSQWRITNQSKERVAIAVNNVADVPHIVTALVQGGALITGVHLQEETVEELFLRLCHKKETPCEPTNC
jgi:ABC-2 type transport system ATP-binding protein